MLPVHCYCCLLWLKLWLRLKLKLRLRLWLRLKLHSAQKQGKRGEGFTCSNSHSLLSTLTMDASKGACEGWRLVLGAARAPHRPLPSLAPCLCLFLSQLLELPLPLQLLTVPILSSQPFSWGQASRTRPGGSYGAVRAHFDFHP